LRNLLRGVFQMLADSRRFLTVADQPLPIRKYVTVWIKNRKNPPRQDGSQTVSRTLEWVEYGQRLFMSLGRNATAAYARQAKVDKEKELNSREHRQTLVPITWKAFREKYLGTLYPGYDKAGPERAEAAKKWAKSFASMRSERLSLDNFGRLVIDDPKREQPDDWLHEVGAVDRETFAVNRLAEVGSGESVDADLRNLRTAFNVAIEWKHYPAGANPFAGRKKATIGKHRKRAKKAENGNAKKAAHYTRLELVALFDQADREVAAAPEDWQRQRLRALVYFEAYTGARIGEALHLEWHEVQEDDRVAFLTHKDGHDLKTEGSEAPIGLPDVLVAVLRQWRALRKEAGFVFPNTAGRPWTGGVKETKHLFQLKELARRAGLSKPDRVTWKMFRHSFSTLGKGQFKMSEEQVQAQLRHEDTETQKHYTHADLEALASAVKGMDFRTH
jgi:integrase